jgi:hypothetical protein
MNQKPQASSAASPPAPSRSPAARDEAAKVVKASVGEDARNVTSEAVQFATDIADKAAQSAQRQFASGKERAADTIGHLAGALRHTGEQLGTDDMPLVNDYLGRAANQAEGFADYLKKTSFGDVVGDLERMARRQPLLFVGSALVVGLLGGRFLKSSPPPERTAASRDAIAGGVGTAR